MELLHVDHPVERLEQPVVVSDHEQSGRVRSDVVMNEAHHAFRRRGIEVASGFIGNHDFGFCDQCSTDRQSLPFAL